MGSSCFWFLSEISVIKSIYRQFYSIFLTATSQCMLQMGKWIWRTLCTFCSGLVVYRCRTILCIVTPMWNPDMGKLNLTKRWLCYLRKAVTSQRRLVQVPPLISVTCESVGVCAQRQLVRTRACEWLIQDARAALSSVCGAVRGNRVNRDSLMTVALLVWNLQSFPLHLSCMEFAFLKGTIY